ncbi:hypothetical protein GCM10020331_050730 [Ectobacillus funiculus]
MNATKRGVVSMNMQVPTILIGLGGIGSTITHNVYEKNSKRCKETRGDARV